MKPDPVDPWEYAIKTLTEIERGLTEAFLDFIREQEEEGNYIPLDYVYIPPKGATRSYNHDN